MRGAGVTEGHVVELEGAAARACGTAANGGLHAGACVQHLPYAVGGDVGARQEHEQHGGHEHGYEDLDQVGDVGGREPISISPASTRRPPNQRTATVLRFSTRPTSGNMAAIHLPT